jgi:hypothetical protein
MWFYNLKLNWNILGHTAMAKIPFESHVKHAHTHKQNPSKSHDHFIKISRFPIEKSHQNAGQYNIIKPIHIPVTSHENPMFHPL